MTRMKKLLLACIGSIALALAFVVPASAIVGGQAETAPPWMGSMQNLSGAHACGATLVAPTWAMTAFHCVEPVLDTPEKVQIRFGSADRTNGGVVARVVDVVVQDNASLVGGDIALMKLDAPVNLPVAQLSSATPADGSDVKMIGWGLTCTQSFPPFFYCGDAPVQMQGATVKLSPDAYCNSIGTNIVGDRELCVGSYFAGKSACYGDSGGPSIVGDRVVGVTSRGAHLFLYGNCQIAPAIYTDVSVHRSWIASVTGV